MTNNKVEKHSRKKYKTSKWECKIRLDSGQRKIELQVAGLKWTTELVKKKVFTHLVGVINTHKILVK